MIMYRYETQMNCLFFFKKKPIVKGELDHLVLVLQLQHILFFTMVYVAACTVGNWARSSSSGHALSCNCGGSQSVLQGRVLEMVVFGTWD